jgi:hypothetical protein
MLEPGYKEYLVKGVVVQAKKTPGGRFYYIILPGGERITHLAEVFEKVATLMEVPIGHCTK